MSIEYRSTIDAPVEEVFAWHERPGALTRLIAAVLAGLVATALAICVLMLPDPAPTLAEVEETTRRTTSQVFAPSAMRTPNSFVRIATP